MMTLMDRDGNPVERTLTNTSTGLFELRAPGPGEYRVRAERIGYATTFSAFFGISAGETFTVEVSAPVEAVTLEGITAAVGPRCEVRPEEGMAVARVWNEARKALAAAAWTQERGLYRYEMLGINRLLDERGRRVEVEDRVYRQSLVPAPYVARLSGWTSNRFRTAMCRTSQARCGSMRRRRSFSGSTSATSISLCRSG